jgi:hypothetical protein
VSQFAVVVVLEKRVALLSVVIGVKRKVTSCFRRDVNDVGALLVSYILRVVILYRRFGTNFESSFSGDVVLDCLTLGTNRWSPKRRYGINTLRCVRSQNRPDLT